MLTVVLFVCLFFAGCHYLLYYPQWVLGAGRLSSLAVGGEGGGGGVGGHFMGRKVIFRKIIGFGGSFPGVKALTGGSFL